jgi:predicted SprT family Zn-dependent metalloprotease
MDLKKAQQISDQLSKRWGIKEPPKVELMKDSKKGKCICIGYYERPTNRLGINKYVLNGYKDKDITNYVIKHELMHALSYQQRGDAHSHDKYFMDLCKKCGLDQQSAAARKKPTEHTKRISCK